LVCFSISPPSFYKSDRLEKQESIKSEKAEKVLQENVHIVKPLTPPPVANEDNFKVNAKPFVPSGLPLTQYVFFFINEKLTNVVVSLEV
jgi:hypothetical protein